MVPMKRKVVLFFITISLLVGLFGGTVSAATVTVAKEVTKTMDVNFENAGIGIVNVLYNTGTTKKVKLLVEYDTKKYYYNLKSNAEYVSFPLQFGDGDYTIKIYENTSGSSYQRVYYTKQTVDVEDDLSVYLQSIQEVLWSDDDAAIILADQLVEEALIKKNAGLFRNAVLTWDKSKYTATQNEALEVQRAKYFENSNIVPLTEDEIIDVLYSYVIENITYDYDKIKTLSYDYTPDIDQVLEDGTGICYDYSVLFASMLRSQNIPAKLVKGYTVNTDVYHAWNEIYLSSTGEWIVVDTTFDAYYYQNKLSFEFQKDTDDYSASMAY